MTAPIRVLMITSDWPDLASWGGTATFISRQVDFLRAAGVDVDVFRFRGGGKPLRYVSAWLDVQRRGRYDLVHAQFGQSGLLALPKRLPLVVTFRGDDLEGVLSNATGRLTARGRLLPLLSRVVARRADATIVVSAHMKAFLHRQARPHVIPSGLDLERFRLIPQAEARRHLDLPAEGRLVLFVGSPTSSRKRYDLARRAVEIVKRSGPVKLVLGWAVPHEQIPYFMNACDALVFTSRQEGSPNVVKEALACNLPVVSVAIGDVPERLRDLAGCEVCADDEPETIATALIRTPIFPTQRADFLGRLANYFSFACSASVAGTFLLRRCEYLIVESPPLFLGFAGLWLSWRTRAAMVFNVSDLWPETAVRLGILRAGSFGHRLAAWLEGFCYRHAAFVSGQTKTIVENIADRFPQCRTYHFSNGVNTRAFHPDRRTAAARAALGADSADACVILYAGLHGLAQGLDRVLDAAETLRADPRLCLVLVGDGPAKERLMQQSRERDLSNVRFLAPLPSDQVPPLLAAADIVLVPLATHIPGATPSKLYEAMA